MAEARIGLSQGQPADGHKGKQQEGEEDRAPAKGRDDARANERRDGGKGHEHQHRKGHDARHLPARIEIAHHRQRDDARARRPQPLQHAGREDQLQAGGDIGQQRTDDIEPGPQKNDAAAPERIRQGPRHQGARAHADDKGGQDKLRVIGGLGAELGRDLGQGRQHRVDRKGDGGEHHAHQRDEFALAQAFGRGGGGVGHSCAFSCSVISAITLAQSSGGCAPGRAC